MTKRILSAVFAILLIFSVAACGEKKTEENAELKAFVEGEAGKIFVEGIVYGFENSAGIKSEASLGAEGNTLCIYVKLVGIDDVPEETKAALQTALDAAGDDLAEDAKPIKSIVSSVEGIKYYICEEDGDVLSLVEVEV